MQVDENITEVDAHGMVNASVIGRPERTPSLGYTKDRKRFTDFGVSARRADGQPDSGDVLELRVRVNAAQDGMSKAETMRQIARQLTDEATQALVSAAHGGEEPPPWVQAFMISTGWEHYHQLHNGAGRAIAESAPHIGGVAGFSFRADAAPSSQTQADQGQHRLDDSAQAVPAETNHAHETIEAFAAEIVAEIGEPCHKCGCTLSYRNLVGESVCHQCLPRPQKYALGVRAQGRTVGAIAGTVFPQRVDGVGANKRAYDARRKTVCSIQNNRLKGVKSWLT